MNSLVEVPSTIGDSVTGLYLNNFLYASRRSDNMGCTPGF